MHLVVFISMLLAYIYLAHLVGILGQKRRIGFLGYFLISLLFTPIIGLIILVVSRIDRPKKEITKDTISVE